MEEIDEEWRPTNNNSKMGRGDTIIEVSNRGRIKRKNGSKEYSTLRQIVSINGKNKRIYRFIAEQFIQKTEEDIELERDCIDHITHYPIGMNVNDVRNLRYCTHKENNNFDEGKYNRSKSQRKVQKILHLKYQLNKPRSDFGKRYLLYYGYSVNENPSQYNKEWKYYHRHKKCSWE